MDDLDPEYREWAERFGARWGAEYPRPRNDQNVISRAFSDVTTELGNGRTIQPAEWIEKMGPAAEAAGRALGQLPDGTWGDALTSVVEKYGHPLITSVQIVLDPSGNRECPDALDDQGFLEEIAGDPVYLFGEAWAEQHLPPGTACEVDAPWVADRPWNDALHELAELVTEAFKSAIRASAQRLVDSPPVLSWARYAPPAPQPFGVSHTGAELLVAEWMKHLGEDGAKVTRASGDGGIDVRGPRYVAQVKHYAGNVGVEPIRELAGVAAVEGRAALFFTSVGYAAGAITFADRANVALFVFNAEAGSLSGVNERGRRLRQLGLD